jgi:hypothetical protein
MQMDRFDRADVRELRDAFLARRPAVDQEFGEMSTESLHWQPAPGRWSIAQCLQHLCQTGFSWADHLSPRLFAALRRGVDHREAHRPGPVGRWIVRFMEDGSKRAKAPSRFRPRDVSHLETIDLLRAFTALGHSWEATLLRATQIDLSHLRVGSPAAPMVLLPLGTWLYALSAHEDRHLEQARRVADMPGFPG